MTLTSDEKTSVMVALRERQLWLGEQAAKAKELNLSENYVFWVAEIALSEAAYKKILIMESAS